MHARLEANQILDIFLRPLVERHQEIAGAERLGGDFLADAPQPGAEAGSGGARFQKRGQALFQRVVVGEGIMGGARLEKEIKRIVDGHFHDQFHLDAQFGHFFREDHAGVPVGERVLLPVDEVPAAGDFLGITQHGRAAMGRGPEPDDMRGMPGGPVVGVTGFVIEGGVDGLVQRVLYCLCCCLFSCWTKSASPWAASDRKK